VALAVQNLCWGIIAVFAGGLADRFGNAKAIVAGTILYALGMLLMSGVDTPWMLNVSTGLLVGAGVAQLLINAFGWMTALNIPAAMVHWPINPVARPIS